MGKQRKSQDKMYISATEQRNLAKGGYLESTSERGHALPFDHCALSLTRYMTPVCLKEGVLFDLLELVPYIQKHKANPVTGEACKSSDIIRLNMSKNESGVWHCPITCKEFNESSVVVCIRTTGNVFSYEAVKELNIKLNSYEDLMDGTPFKKNDIIKLFDNSDETMVKTRDVSNFVHLSKVRDEETKNIASSGGNINLNSSGNSTALGILKELEKTNKDSAPEGLYTIESFVKDASKLGKEDVGIDVMSFIKKYTEATQEAMPLLRDLNPGTFVSGNHASAAFTSSAMSVCTDQGVRFASFDEVRQAIYKKVKSYHMGAKATQKHKDRKTKEALPGKGYVQMQTSFGNLNIEIHCDISPMTCANFLQLCEQGAYDATAFHRIVPGFCAQAGEPAEAWKKSRPEGCTQSCFSFGAFDNELDSRVGHTARGVLSMANAGPGTNTSQFFFLLADEAKYLDQKHTVFGQLVGGMSVLDRIEAHSKMQQEDNVNKDVAVKIKECIVITNPFTEAEETVLKETLTTRNKRIKKETEYSSVLPTDKRAREVDQEAGHRKRIAM